MEEEAASNEPLLLKKSKALTLETFTFFLILLMALFITTCLLALILSFLNSYILMSDLISARVGIIYEPITTPLAGIRSEERRVGKEC